MILIKLFWYKCRDPIIEVRWSQRIMPYHMWFGTQEKACQGQHLQLEKRNHVLLEVKQVLYHWGLFPYLPSSGPEVSLSGFSHKGSLQMLASSQPQTRVIWSAVDEEKDNGYRWVTIAPWYWPWRQREHLLLSQTLWSCGLLGVTYVDSLLAALK